MFFDEELEKNFAFDLRRFRSEELTGLPKLVKKGTSSYDFALENKSLASFHEGFEVILKNNSDLFTIRDDPISTLVEGLLRKNGYTGDVHRI